MNIVQLILRFLLGATFLLSGITKLFSLSVFVDVIQSYISFSLMFGYVIALSICVFEIILALLLFWKKTVQSASFGILALTLFFTGFQVLTIVYGTTNECFCFGSITDDVIGWKTLTRNILILFFAWILLHSNISITYER